MPKAPAEIGPSDFGRRDFLRASLGGVLGIAAGAALPDVLLPIQQEVADITGESVGNVSQQEMLASACGQQPTAECFDEYASSQAIDAIVIKPPLEEMIFRGFPSALMDTLSYLADVVKDPDDPNLKESVFKTTLCGHEGPLNSEDLRVGLMTTTVFAYTHNAKANVGFVFNNLPVAQFAFGGVAWALQRKFGLGASTAAHVAINARIFLGS